MARFFAIFVWFISLPVNAFHWFTLCDTNAGMSDSYVLALSAQPGFCQTYGYEAGKPECLYLSKDSYQSRHLSLHGLWPNQKACGLNYNFCGVMPQMNHCHYPPVPLSPAVAENLRKMMPSYQYGSCLERHEWNKHGSCQLLPANDYFALAMRLNAEIDQSVFGQYLTQNYGKRVQSYKLKNKFAEAFGQENSQKFYLGCKQGVLVDIYIILPALISADASMQSLLDQAPIPRYRRSCPSSILISDFTSN